MTLSSVDIAAIVKAVKPLIPTASQIADAVWAKEMSATTPQGSKVSGTSSYFLRKSLVLALGTDADIAEKGIASDEMTDIVKAAVIAALAGH